MLQLYLSELISRHCLYVLVRSVFENGCHGFPRFTLYIQRANRAAKRERKPTVVSLCLSFSWIHSRYPI